MATEILSQSTSRGWEVIVTVDDARTRRRLLSAAVDAAAKPRSVLKLWRDIVLKRMESRFGSEMGPSGRWAPLSLFSTVPIRQRRGLTRLSPPRGGGGTSVRPLRSSFQQYFNAWTNRSQGVTHRPLDRIQMSAFLSQWSIGVDHIAVVNEYRRTTKGAIPEKHVPARSVAYIRGDKRLLDKLVEVFAQHIVKAMEKARG